VRNLLPTFKRRRKLPMRSKNILKVRESLSRKKRSILRNLQLTPKLSSRRLSLHFLPHNLQLSHSIRTVLTKLSHMPIHLRVSLL